MQSPLKIVFRDVPHSDAAESVIREKVQKLEQFCDRMTSCRVTVGMITKHKHQGRLYNVRVEVLVPGSEIVVNRDRGEDLYVAIRDAFDAARRQLEDYTRRINGKEKFHEPQSRGQVVRIMPEEGYGFIETADGTQVYFHRYAMVQPEFERVNEGDEVSFLMEAASEGMQANRVSVLKQRKAA
jgi:ribosomal subunit interface protein